MPEGAVPVEEQLASIRFFYGGAYTADITGVRAIHPGLKTYEDYLREAGWRDLPVLTMPEGGNSWGA